MTQSSRVLQFPCRRDNFYVYAPSYKTVCVYICEGKIMTPLRSFVSYIRTLIVMALKKVGQCYVWVSRYCVTV